MSAASSAPTTVLDDLARRIEALERRDDSRVAGDSLAIVAFSGELDRLLAAFVIATGAAASETRVSIFFTFWATAALRRADARVRGKPLVERMFGWMLPRGPGDLPLSRMDMLGVGRRVMAREMRRKSTPDLPTLISIAAESEVRINVCEMSMSLMGIRAEELIEYPHLRFCGVASFLEEATRADATLFI